MQSIHNVMDEIRERQLSRGIQCITVLGFFALMVSLSRTLFWGWNNLMYIHMVSYTIILVITLFEKSFSYTLKSLIIISIIFILALTALINLGLAGYGFSWFLLFQVRITPGDQLILFFLFMILTISLGDLYSVF